LNLWPESLFARTVLLVASLIVISHFIWLEVFQRLARPTPHHIAAHLAGLLQPIRKSLSTLADEHEADYFRALRAREHIRLFRDDPPRHIQIVGASSEMDTVEPLIKPLLGLDTRVRLSHHGHHAHTVWWVLFSAGDKSFWARVPKSHIEPPLPWSWLGWTALGIILSLLGALLILWRVNQPLRALSEATRLVGQGMTPPLIQEQGPMEIRRLSHAFNQMLLDLQRLTADRELLLASVSHDLRTPLARLRLAIEMFEETRSDDGLKEGIIQDINDMDAIIDQFLAYVREGQADNTAVLKDITVCIKSVSDRFIAAGHRLVVRLAPLPKLAVHPGSIERLLSNLIDNALKHADGIIDVETRLDHNRVFVSVLDRGPGIAKADIDRVKLPFTRLERSRGGPGGTGLGLAIVERIAGNHEGEFQLLDRPGGGLEARLVLPLPKPAVTANAAERPTNSVDIQPRGLNSQPVQRPIPEPEAVRRREP
jgi:two-component system, OmpR family, osmolarity sensor histidine kinase EnvZ